MSMNVGGKSGGLNSDINVTPLVDVMLVLLIIMMLVAPDAAEGRGRHDADRRERRRRSPTTRSRPSWRSTRRTGST